MAAAPSSLLLLVSALACWVAASPVSATAIWEVTNEVGPYAEKADLAACRRSAVCGMVQTNSWGVSSEAFCRCPGRQECPLRWDNEDGHSITHGSNQYKFCQLAPQLPPCAAGQLAMTDELVTYHDAAETPMAHHELLHCRCPADHQLALSDSQWRQLPDSDVIVTEKGCVEMPKCTPGQHCKFVTRTPRANLVQVNCACAGRMTCPSDTERAVESLPMGRGVLHSIFCR